jgi:hypothetical protein
MLSTTETVKLVFCTLILSLRLPCLYLHSIFFWSFLLKNTRNAKMKSRDSYCISLENSRVKHSKNSSNSFPCDVRVLLFFTEITVLPNSVTSSFSTYEQHYTHCQHCAYFDVSLHRKEASVIDHCHFHRLGLIYTGGTRWRSWLRHCATSQKVAGSIPDDIIGIFHWHNPCGRTMALGLTQPLTEMSTKHISWG